MEIRVPVKGVPAAPGSDADLELIVQLRFFADRHLVIITDAQSRAHGTVYQVDVRLDESASTELHPALDPAAAVGAAPIRKQAAPRLLDDDFEAELDRQMEGGDSEKQQQHEPEQTARNAAAQPRARAIPLTVDMYPVLGSNRDNQWALLLLRRIGTAIAESFIAADMDEAEDRQRQDLKKMTAMAAAGFVPTARLSGVAAQRAFSMTMMTVVHIPAVLDAEDGMRHGAAVMDAVRDIEHKLRAQLHGTAEGEEE